MKNTTVIDGYTVEFNPCNDNGLTECHIWKSGVTRGTTYSGSLQVLMDVGVLCNCYDSEHTVEQRTIDKIEAWANDMGYSS